MNSNQTCQHQARRPRQATHDTSRKKQKTRRKHKTRLPSGGNRSHPPRTLGKGWMRQHTITSKLGQTAVVTSNQICERQARRHRSIDRQAIHDTSRRRRKGVLDTKTRQQGIRTCAPSVRERNKPAPRSGKETSFLLMYFRFVPALWFTTGCASSQNALIACSEAK